MPNAGEPCAGAQMEPHQPRPQVCRPPSTVPNTCGQAAPWCARASGRTAAQGPRAPHAAQPLRSPILPPPAPAPSFLRSVPACRPRPARTTGRHARAAAAVQEPGPPARPSRRHGNRPRAWRLNPDCVPARSHRPEPTQAGAPRAAQCLHHQEGTAKDMAGGLSSYGMPHSV